MTELKQFKLGLFFGIVIGLVIPMGYIAASYV
jgi:hypothetical protein